MLLWKGLHLLEKLHLPRIIESIISKLLSKGAASEGDAHAAFNFSATLECPGSKEIFFHRRATTKKYFCSDFFPNRRPPLSPLHFIEKFSKKRPLCSWWTANVESRPIVQFFSSVATMVTPSPRLCTSSTEATELLLGGPLMEWQPSGNITEQIFAEYDSPWCCNG